MDKYPLRPKTPQEGKGYIDFATALKWCNEAFFDGFISAHLETADELEKLTIEERINYCFRAVEKCAVLRRETPPELNFFGGGQSNSPYSLQAVRGHCSPAERGRSCMLGKKLPPIRITPEEAIALFEYATVEEMYRAKALYDTYREAKGTDTDSLWDIMSLLSFVYDTARIQGIREERAKRT